MGYKFKATMYYSDSEIEQFLKGKEVKPNGKKSVSHYLYSLVKKEREKTFYVEKSHENSHVVRMHSQYKNIQWCHVSGEVSFSLIRDLKANAAAKKRVIYKDLMREIDVKIREHIDTISMVRLFKSYNDKGFLIVIKSKVTCFHNGETMKDGYTHGQFITEFGLIYVSSKEWERWGGMYDFENIKYIKFRDISDPYANKLKGLCQIAEKTFGNTVGAFFIPVLQTTKTFPLEKNSEPVFIGVDINFNQDRVKFKKMNKSQKERYFKKTLDCNY